MDMDSLNESTPDSLIMDSDWNLNSDSMEQLVEKLLDNMPSQINGLEMVECNLKSSERAVSQNDHLSAEQIPHVTCVPTTPMGTNVLTDKPVYYDYDEKSQAHNIVENQTIKSCIVTQNPPKDPATTPTTCHQAMESASPHKVINVNYAMGTQTSNQSYIIQPSDRTRSLLAHPTNQTRDNVVVRNEAMSLSSIPGNVRKIVQIPQGMKPSTEVAMHVHNQLKKAGNLDPSNSTVVYLVSTNDGQPVLQDKLNLISSAPKYTCSKENLSDAAPLPGIASFMPKEHITSFPVQMPYVSLGISGSSHYSPDGISTTAVSSSTSNPEEQIHMTTVTSGRSVNTQQSLPSIDTLLNTSDPTKQVTSISTNSATSSKYMTKVSPRSVLCKSLPSTQQVQGSKEHVLGISTTSQIRNFEVNKNIMHTTEDQFSSSVSLSLPLQSKSSTLSLSPQSPLKSTGATLNAFSASNTMQTTATSKSTSIRLPVLGPTGLKLSNSNKKYIPILCQITHTAKSSELPSGSNINQALLILPKDSKSLKPKTQKNNTIPSLTKKPSASVSPDVSLQTNLIQQSPTNCSGHGKYNSKSASLVLPNCSEIQASESTMSDDNTGIAKAGSSLCKWQIMDGALTKQEESAESRLEPMLAKMMVRLPLGTGSAPSLVTRDQVNDSDVGAITEDTTCKTKVQPEAPNSKLTLKQLLHEKRKMMSAAIYQVESKAPASIFVPPKNSDKDIVETTISAHPHLFNDMPEYRKRKVAYAYGLDGLSYTPGLLISNPDTSVEYIGANCDTIQTNLAENYWNIVEKPNQQFGLDVDIFNASLLTLKENKQLVLDASGVAKLQEMKLRKEYEQNESSVQSTTETEVCYSSKDLESFEEAEIALRKYPKGKSTDVKHGVFTDLIQPSITAQSAHKGKIPMELPESTEGTSANRAFSMQSMEVQEEDSESEKEMWDDNHEGLDGTAKNSCRLDLDGELEIDFLDGVPFVNGVEIEVPAKSESMTAFCCYMCGYCSLDQENVTKHWLSEHVSQKPYLCGVCRSAAFTNTYKLMNHIKSFHSSFTNCMPMVLKPSPIFDNTLIMAVGKDENITSNRLQALWNTVDKSEDNNHDDETKGSRLHLYCNNCTFKCVTVLGMRSHMNRNHPKPYCFNCTECQRLFTCRFDMIRHKRIVHGKIDKDEGKDIINASTQKKVSVKIAGGFMDWIKFCEVCCDANLPGNSSRLTCLLCKGKGVETLTENAKLMWSHLWNTHKWPTYVYCNTCALKIRVLDFDRKYKKTSCPTCCHAIYLEPIIVEESVLEMYVYICKICSYKTMERSSMCRHVKYSYANFRPYICPYCNYTSVENAKVKKHVLNAHSSECPSVKINVAAIEDMKEKIELLVNKVTMKVKYNELDLLLGEDVSLHSCVWNEKFQKRKNLAMEEIGMAQQDLKESLRVVKQSSTGAISYQCTDCDFAAQSLLTFSRHRRKTHRDLNAPMVMTQQQKSKIAKSSRISGQHYQCNICRYCCLDRSSMTRHIKYMHMHERPHACPYCAYKNVEKTKVRIHVQSAHRGSPTYVNSDMNLLKMMAERVRGNYTRISKSPDSSAAPVGREERKKQKKSKSPLRMYPPEKKRGKNTSPEATPEYLVMNAHNTLMSSAIVRDEYQIKEEKRSVLDYGIDVKSEPDSDIDDVCNEIDGYIAGYPMDPGDLEEDELDLELKLEEASNLTEIAGDMDVHEEPCKNRDDGHNTDDHSVKTNNNNDETSQDLDDDHGDVDWVVETIDTESEEDSDEDQDEDLDQEEREMVNSSDRFPEPLSRKRKRTLEHDAFANIVLSDQCASDPKLRKKPVVVVQDIIKQILAGQVLLAD